MNIKTRLKKFDQFKTSLVVSGKEYTYHMLAESMTIFEKQIRPNMTVPIVGGATLLNVAKLFTALDKGAIAVPMEQLQNPSIWQHEGHPFLNYLRKWDKPGLILITSGSSGTPKAALHNINIMLQEKWQIIDAQRWHPRQEYCTLLLLGFDHIGGFNTLCSTLFNGGTLVVPESRDPEHIADLVYKYNVECLPASPTFLRMFLMKTNRDLPSLKLITYGTEPMPQTVLNEVHSRYPDVKLKQTFGMTEVGIYSTMSRPDGSTWMKIKDAEIRDGFLYLKSSGSFMGYLNRVMSDPTLDGWFATGDKVETDGEWIRIIGRETEFINVGGEKIHPTVIENLLLKIPEIEDCKVEGEANPIMGQIIKATIKASEDKRDLKDKIKTLFEFEKMPKWTVPQRIVYSNDSLHNSRLKKKRG
jgi:acyl-coenzyme A synthetase/AMP-(fatty) acid ligase